MAKCFNFWMGGGGASNPKGTLDKYTWAEISEISSSGLAENYFSVGDTKTITLDFSKYDFSDCPGFSNVKGKKTYLAFIIGINHNASEEGENLIHFQIGKSPETEDLVAIGCYDNNDYNIEITDTSYEGKAGLFMNIEATSWEESNMKLVTLPAIKTILDNSLIPYIKPVIKETIGYKKETELFILSLEEMNIYEVPDGYNHPADMSGLPYDYYANLYNDENHQIFYSLDSGEECDIWIRGPLNTRVSTSPSLEPEPTVADIFEAIGHNNISAYPCNTVLAIAPCFCI